MTNNDLAEQENNPDEEDEEYQTDWENSVETSDLDSTDSSSPENNLEVKYLL